MRTVDYEGPEVDELVNFLDTFVLSPNARAYAYAYCFESEAVKPFPASIRIAEMGWTSKRSGACFMRSDYGAAQMILAGEKFCLALIDGDEDALKDAKWEIQRMLTERKEE